MRQELNFGLQDLNPHQLGFELLRRPAANGTRASFCRGRGAVPRVASAADRRRREDFGNEVRAPRVEVRNTSQKAVRNVEMGWILRDERGRDFVAGSVAPRSRWTLVQCGRQNDGAGHTALLTLPGQPVTWMRSWPLSVMWSMRTAISGSPSRRDILEATSDPILRRALSTSPEQQRLGRYLPTQGHERLEAELSRLK